MSRNIGGQDYVYDRGQNHIESDDEERALGFEDLGEHEKRGIFARYHNSIVGHLGADRTLKALFLGGHS